MNWLIGNLDKGKPGPVALLQGEELQGWQWVSIQDILSVKHKYKKTLLWYYINIPDICHFFTRAKFLENKIFTEKTRKLRQNTQ